MAIRTPSFVRRAVDRRLEPYVAMLVRLEVERRLSTSPQIAGQFLPVDPSSDTLLLPVFPPPNPQGEALVAPEELWEIKGDLDGQEHVASMLDILAANGVDHSTFGAILEFGCGTGRMLREVRVAAPSAEMWGVDINAASIDWCQRHLAPDMQFAVCTSQPSLPFTDGRFDFVYAGSVFTHLSELGDSWACELHRLLGSSGHLYITVQDAAYVETLLGMPPDNEFAQCVHDARDLLASLGSKYSVVSIGRGSKDAMVFHDRASLARRWDGLFELIAAEDDAYSGQSGLLFRRR